jgi:hypothetical protein
MSARTALIGGLVAAAALVGASGVAAKELKPGDLRACNAETCVPVVSAQALKALSRFYYTGPQPAVVSRPRWGAPAFELRFRNGYVTGAVGGARLDRFLSFGVHDQRFRQGVWYRVPPRAAVELRNLTEALEPLALSRALVRRSR